MRTLDRYIAGIFMRSFGLAIGGLTLLFVVQAFLGELLDHEYPVIQLITHNLLNVPQIAVQMAPPAVLIATVLTLSGLNRSNELVACYSIGFGLNRVVALILSLVFMISCVSLVMQDRILPPVFKKKTAYYWRVMKKRPELYLDVKQDKIWYRSKNLIYNLRSFDAKTKSIQGMAVYSFDNQFDLKQVVNAERALYTPKGWRLLDGTVTIFGADGAPDSQYFKEKDLPITETPKDFQEIEKEVDGLRLKELWHYIQRTKAAGADTKSYEVKFHSRISLSFIPLVMCILGVPFSTRSRREGGVAKDLGMCLGVTFFYWLFYSIGLSLGSNGALPPLVAAWLPSVVFAGLAAALLSKHQHG